MTFRTKLILSFLGIYLIWGSTYLAVKLSISMLVILVAFGTFLATLTGGLIGLRHKARIHLFISFSAGALIAVAFFDVLPEIFNLATEHAVNVTWPLTAVVIGFLVIHLLEKLAVIHNSHEDEYATHKHPLVGVVGASSLVIHSFLDGVGIGLGFQAGNAVGIAVSLAVLSHDVCDGLNIVTLMLVNKNTPRRSIGFLFLGALTPVLGALSTLLFAIPPAALLVYLGVFVGVIIYIAASDLLPEAHSKHSSFGMLALTVLGALMIFGVTRLL